MKPTLQQLRGTNFTSVQKVASSPHKLAARTIEIFQGGGKYWWANYNENETTIMIEEVEPVERSANGVTEILYHQKSVVE